MNKLYDDFSLNYENTKFGLNLLLYLHWRIAVPFQSKSLYTNDKFKTKNQKMEAIHMKGTSVIWSKSKHSWIYFIKPYPFKCQPHKKIKHTRATADKLFDCVWPFPAVGA